MVVGVETTHRRQLPELIVEGGYQSMSPELVINGGQRVESLEKLEGRVIVPKMCYLASVNVGLYLDFIWLFHDITNIELL